ncbi:MAG: sensor histidine kinase [Caldilineaceae bacterium]|nr:sensor histidine kinase [Caldilineaceae bacterium]
MLPIRTLWSNFGNSLRGQLLLWISLPVLVVLLTFALAGVQGHDQAMHELVQTRADSLVRAGVALIEARIDRGQDALVRLSTLPLFHEERIEQAALTAALPAFFAEFSAGAALYTEDRRWLGASFPWQGRIEVESLARTVATTGNAGVITLFEEGGALLIHAIPVVMTGQIEPRILVGATPVDELGLPSLLGSLSLTEPFLLTLSTADGDPLLIMGEEMHDHDAAHTVLSSAEVGPVDWQLHLHESWDDWIPPVLRFGNMLLLVLVAAVTLSILSAYFGLRQIIYPLGRLNQAVIDLGHGDFEAVERRVGGVQEIEELRMALADMAGQIRQYQQELQGYIGAITLGQEEERKRLARELHDETVQALIALNQQVEMAEHRLVQDHPERAAARLRELRPLIGETIGGIRRQIQNLRPLYLEDLGFVPALEMLVQQIAARCGLVGDFEVSGAPQRRLPPAVEVSGYRIVQEALQNVANHAGASWVHVELIFDPAGITLCIEDDGRGFTMPEQVHHLAQESHYGLLGMQERVRLHKGELHIESEIGEGTRITARLPAELETA